MLSLCASSWGRPHCFPPAVTLSMAASSTLIAMVSLLNCIASSTNALAWFFGKKWWLPCQRRWASCNSQCLPRLSVTQFCMRWGVHEGTASHEAYLRFLSRQHWYMSSDISSICWVRGCRVMKEVAKYLVILTQRLRPMYTADVFHIFPVLHECLIHLTDCQNDALTTS